MNDQKSPEPLTIRQAVAADAAAVREMRLEALGQHPAAFGSDLESAVHLDVAYWQGRIDHVGNGIFVAAAGRGLAGMAGIYVSERPKMRHAGNIWGVYVRPAWRGQGVAGQLIAACVGWARERELRIVKLAVVTTNTPAIRCYMEAGFRVYGVEPLAICYDGVYYDELLMALEL